jgi:hypothetical protein
VTSPPGGRRSVAAVASPWTLLVLAALLALGGGLRIYHLGYRSLATDEANLYWMSRGSAAEIVRQNAAGNSAPPLYAFAVNLVSRLGTAEAALRSLSCAAGIAALAVLYALARRYTSAAGACFAVLLAAVAPAQVFYSQFLREYSLALLCAGVLLLAYDAVQRRPSARTWLAYSAAAAIGMLVQYGLALQVVALNIVFAIELAALDQRRRRLIAWGLAQLAPLAAAALVYDQTLRHQLRPGGFGADYLAAGYWDGSAASLGRILLGNTFELFGFAHPSIWLVQALVLAGAVELRRTPAGRRALWLLVVPILVTIAAACARLYPYLGARQSIPLTAMLYVCAGAGFALVRRVDWKGVFSALLVVWAAAEGLHGSYRQLWSTEPQHLRPLAAVLAARFQPGDRIYVYHDAATPLLYYYPDHQRDWIRGVYSPADARPHREQLARELARPGRVWMVFSNCRALECDAIRREAAALGHPVERIGLETGASLYLALPPPAPEREPTG